MSVRQRVLLLVGAVALAVSACAGTGPADGGSGAQAPEPFEPAASTSDSVAPSTTDASTTDASTTTTTTDPGAVTTTSAPSTTPPPTVPLERLDLQLERIADADRPVAMAAHPVTGERFVAEKGGRVILLDSGRSVLDISGRVSGRNEQGLLGLAFAPDGSALFVNFTDRAGETVVERYPVDGSALMAADVVEVIRVPQLRANHNGGHLAFGPDGHLYIGLGDGGGGGDPGDHGQNPSTLLGTMLRIAPTAAGYEIPPDNPFAEGDGGAPEVFAFGLRNPWRYSFDPATGDLWIADVGQDRFEEISVARAATGGGNGANFGWNEMEGFDTYRQGVEPEDHAPPFAAYAQSSGRCSVTGGEVYRGSEIPSLVGTYVFGDFCTGELFGIDAEGDGTMVALRIDRVSELASFATDAAGELYALSLGGGIFRITG